MSTKPTLKSQIETARRVGTPLLGIDTADPASTLREILAAAEGEPVVQWDAVRGIRYANQAGAKAMPEIVANSGIDTAEFATGTQNPVTALEVLMCAPPDTCAVLFGSHRHIDNAVVAQAVWNLRDAYKADGRTLILLGPSIQLPAELTQDVMLYDDPLPTDAQLGGILADIHSSAEVEPPAEDIAGNCTTAMRGLSAFAAEQAAAFSLTRQGMDVSVLWDRKRRAVEQTPGLRFAYGGKRFADIGGLDSLKELGLGLFKRRDRRPGLVVFIDELEKWAGGIMNASGDNGVDKDAFSVVLKEIAEHEYPGLTLVGPPGTGKTIFASALAAENDVPLLECDLGAAKGSLMGESQQKIRAVFKTIHALAGHGGALIVAAANNLGDDIPQELMRRVARLGIYYVDLPTAAERKLIWSIHTKRYSVEGQKLPDDGNWTGADIETCCDLADRLSMSLIDASRRLVPIAKSNPERIDALRQKASGRWQSANEVGVYVMPDKTLPVPTGARKLRMEGE